MRVKKRPCNQFLSNATSLSDHRDYIGRNKTVRWRMYSFEILGADFTNAIKQYGAVKFKLYTDFFYQERQCQDEVCLYYDI